MWIAVLYLLASLLSIGGIYLAYHYLARTPIRQTWLYFGGALLLFAALTALLAYRALTSQSLTFQDQASSILSLLTAGTAILGAWQTGKRAQTVLHFEQENQGEYELLQQVLNQLPLPIAIKDLNLTYRAANPSFERFLGRPRLEIIGRKASDFFPRPQANAFQHADEQVLHMGESLVQEHEVTGTNGKRWMQITRIPITGNNGSISGILISNQDITAYKQLERELEEQKLLVNAIIEEKQTLVEERQHSLENLNEMLQFEHLLVLIAAHFIDADLAKIDQGIRHALQSIGTQTGMDRCQLLLFDDGRNELNLIYEWTSAEAEPTLQNGNSSLPAGSPSWTGLAPMQIIHIPSLDSLPRESYEVSEYMREHGIQSLTAVPLISGRFTIGYLLLESLSKEILWESDYLDMLKTAAGILVQALESKQAKEALIAEQEKTQKHLEILQQHNLENNLLNELSDLLQVCRTVDEAYPVIARYTQQLVPVSSGALYLERESDDPIERVAAWGDAQPVETELVRNECWALRRGRPHLVKDSKNDLNCAHLKSPLPKKYICIPLIAQGETIGLLHLRPAKGETASLATRLEDYMRVSQEIAEQIALSLSNLSLRDMLRSQAIRDPLTGLFNRRYMEETLEREIRRAVRHTTPVSVIMFDVDYLKNVNDSFGHDAGDIVLKTLGGLMMKIFRGEDVPCRYGGDEFTIVLPEATVSEAFRRAEQFREAFKDIIFEHENKRFGPLTLSLGIAAYPDHGASVERLMQTADAAAYAAKTQGRDRVMIGGISEE